MNTKNFGDYIQFLRDNFSNLITYKHLAHGFSEDLERVNTDLFDDDPFVVYDASIAATAEFANSKLYH